MNGTPCSLCKKVAWYAAGKKFYCKDHLKEAKEACKVEGKSRREYNGFDLHTPRPEGS